MREFYQARHNMQQKETRTKNNAGASPRRGAREEPRTVEGTDGDEGNVQGQDASVAKDRLRASRADNGEGPSGRDTQNVNDEIAVEERLNLEQLSQEMESMRFTMSALELENEALKRELLRSVPVSSSTTATNSTMQRKQKRGNKTH